MYGFLYKVKLRFLISNFLIKQSNFLQNISFWSLDSSPQKCISCPTGFTSNYFFANNPTAAYYNPYTCYQVQAGTTNFYQSRFNCRSKGLRTTTMIIRTRAEYADAERFFDLFGGNFWVRFFF